jgi:hypothetical protein
MDGGAPSCSLSPMSQRFKIFRASPFDTITWHHFCSFAHCHSFSCYICHHDVCPSYYSSLEASWGSPGAFGSKHCVLYCVASFPFWKEILTVIILISRFMLLLSLQVSNKTAKHPFALRMVSMLLHRSVKSLHSYRLCAPNCLMLGFLIV